MCRSSRDGTIKIWDSSDISSPVIVMRTGGDHFCNSCTTEIDGKASEHENATRVSSLSHSLLLRPPRHESIGNAGNRAISGVMTVTTLHLTCIIL